MLCDMSHMSVGRSVGRGSWAYPLLGVVGGWVDVVCAFLGCGVKCVLVGGGGWVTLGGVWELLAVSSDVVDVIHYCRSLC